MSVRVRFATTASIRALRSGTRKPQIVAVTKVDVPEARAGGAKLAKLLGRRKKPVKVHLVSAVTGEGLDPLMDAIGRAVFQQAAPRAGGRGRKLAKPRAKV